jgi:hypothetical protein
VGAGIVRVRHKIGRAAEHDARRHLHGREIPFLVVDNFPVPQEGESDGPRGPKFLC